MPGYVDAKLVPLLETQMLRLRNLCPIQILTAAILFCWTHL